MKTRSVDAPPASCPPCHYFCPKDLLTLIFASVTCTSSPNTGVVVYNVPWVHPDGQTDRRTLPSTLSPSLRGR